MFRARGVRPIDVLAIVAAAILLAGGGNGVGQAPLSPGARVVNPTTPAAVDTGYQAVARRLHTATGMHVPHRYVPGQVIVKFTGGAAPETAQWQALSAMGARSIDRRPFANFDVVTLDEGMDAEDAATELSARPDVEYAQAAYLRQALLVPNDPLFAQQWNLAAIDIERAWDISGSAAESVTVAVIDSGLAFENVEIDFEASAFTLGGFAYPALGPITVPFAAAPDLTSPDRFVAPFDFVWGDDHPVDLAGHGTHVTGTIGQLTDNGLGVAGVAFNARIMPIKVLGDVWDFVFGATPVCCGGTDADVAAGIRYAVQFGAQVINLSLGGPDISPVIDDAIRFAVANGAFVAIAGGNSFDRGNPVVWPAASAESIEGAMAVGAVNRDGRRAFYSNTGSYLEIAAPGGDLRQPGGGVVQQTLDLDFVNTFDRPPSAFGPPRFDRLSFTPSAGTSMAAPHVAGLAALLIAQGVTDPAAVEAAIKVFATDLGDEGRDDEYGYGLINAPATLRGLGIAR